VIALGVEGLGHLAPGGRRLLGSVTLAAAPGETLGLLGPNGAGKSTLLRCLWGALKPAEGRVLIDGRDAAHMPARERARLVAAVPQETPPDFALSVREVVETGRTAHARSLFGGDAAGHAAVDAALDRMRLSPLARRPFAALSGGERKRALIARALAQQPRALILDEPANHLDIRHQLEVMALLRELGATVIVAMHDLELAARFCDRLAVLSHGRLVAEGSPETVLTPARVAEVFAVRARIRREPPETGLRLSFDRLEPAA
jgi:iron complex transport system ATP-binding protein